MRCIYLLPLSMLLASSCFNGVSARTQFKDLVDDVLFATFETLDLIDLISMASTNSQIAAIAKAVYLRKYGDYKIDISNIRYGGNQNILITDSAKQIQIGSTSLVLKLLHNFGDLIPELYIDLQYVNVILKNISVPLTRVEFFTTSLKYDMNDILPFSHIFPNLRGMNIQVYSKVNISMIDCAMPSLQHLSILIWDDNYNEMDSIDGMIQKNPQVKSIELRGVPDDYIKFINAALPTLENITFRVFNMDNETVKLENVKHLVFGGCSLPPKNLEYLSCPSLESLEMECREHNFDTWKTFINNHQHLKTMRMDLTNLEELAELTENLDDLTEVELTVGVFRSVQQIKAFFLSHPNLMRAKFSTFQFDVAEMLALRKSLANEWDYEGNGDTVDPELEFEPDLDDYYYDTDCGTVYEFVFTRKT